MLEFTGSITGPQMTGETWRSGVGERHSNGDAMLDEQSLRAINAVLDLGAAKIKSAFPLDGLAAVGAFHHSQ